MTHAEHDTDIVVAKRILSILYEHSKLNNAEYLSTNTFRKGNKHTHRWERVERILTFLEELGIIEKSVTAVSKKKPRKSFRITADIGKKIMEKKSTLWSSESTAPLRR